MQREEEGELSSSLQELYAAYGGAMRPGSGSRETLREAVELPEHLKSPGECLTRDSSAGTRRGGSGGFHPAPVPLQDCSEPSVFSIWNAGPSVSRAKLVEKGMQSYKKMWRRSLQAGLPLESYLFPTIIPKPYFGEPDCMQWNSSLFNSANKITGE